MQHPHTKKYLPLEPSMKWRLEANAARLKRQRENEAIERHRAWVVSWQVWNFSMVKIAIMAIKRGWGIKRLLLTFKRRWIIRLARAD